MTILIICLSAQLCSWIDMLYYPVGFPSILIYLNCFSLLPGWQAEPGQWRLGLNGKPPQDGVSLGTGVFLFCFGFDSKNKQAYCSFFVDDLASLTSKTAERSVGLATYVAHSSFTSVQRVKPEIKCVWKSFRSMYKSYIHKDAVYMICTLEVSLMLWLTDRQPTFSGRM